MAPLVRIENVEKVYRRDQFEVRALDGITLDVPAGDFLALMGPSGSGKSTLLNLIAGIDRPTRGRILVADREISALDESAPISWRSRHVGFIFQLYNLIPVLTAFENVELPLLLSNLTRRQRREHVANALAIVALSDRADHFPRQLSGGQEQRVAIARAIVTDPTILVADEPTGDLDAANAEETLELMSRLNTEFEKTIIMVTHDPHAAARARRVLHLDKGVLGSDQPAPVAG
jgi:ABC-type antimicrobial peptide transport system, ATPase component